MPRKPLTVEGTTLEGGGQIIRIATALSALCTIPIRITNIRGGRPRGGGLKEQHLTAVNWLAAACQADVEGAEVKSREVEFWPGCMSPSGSTTETSPLSSTLLNIPMENPGSVALILQAILPYLLFSSSFSHSSSSTPITLTIQGGTNVSFSPSIDYLTQVLFPTLARIGLPPITTRVYRRGWSTGQTEVGSVSFSITPLGRGTVLPGFVLRERGEVVRLQATVLAPRGFGVMFTQELSSYLARKSLTAPLDLTVEDSHHPKRIYLLLVAETSNGCLLARDHLYASKIKSSLAAVTQTVKTVVDELMAELAHGGCVDEYLRDQLVIFQALARGRSEVYAGVGVLPSLHTRTAWWVVERMLGVEFDEDGSCHGVGFVAGERSVRKEIEKQHLGSEELSEELKKLEI